MKPAWVAAACTALLATGEARAQAPVRLWSCLPPAAEPRLREVLARALPEVAVDLRSGSGPELAAELRHGAAPADVVCGIDAILADALAREQRFLPYAAPPAAALAERFRDPQARFTVPFLAPLVIAVDARKWSEDTAPAGLSDLLFEPRFDGEIVLCAPEALPGLWIAWIRQHLHAGHDEQRITAWLRTLDARVAGYEDSVAAVVAALAEQRGSVTVLPLPDVAAAPGLVSVLPAAGLTVQGLAVAVLAERDSPAARAVCDVLLSRECALALTDAHLVPAERSDLPQEQLPAQAAALRSGMHELEWQDTDAERWFAIWRSVRGTARQYEWLDLTLDALFGLLLAVILYKMSRQKRSAPAAGA